MRTVQIRFFLTLALMGFMVSLPIPSYAMFCPSADLIHNIPLLPTAIKFYKSKRHHHRSAVAYWGIQKYIVTQGHSCEVRLQVVAPSREVAYDMIRDILDSVPFNRAPRYSRSSQGTICLYPVSSRNNLKVTCYRHEGVEQNRPTVTVEPYYTPTPIYPPNAYYGQPSDPRLHHYGHRHGWH